MAKNDTAAKIDNMIAPEKSRNVFVDGVGGEMTLKSKWFVKVTHCSCFRPGDSV